MARPGLGAGHIHINEARAQLANVHFVKGPWQVCNPQLLSFTPPSFHNRWPIKVSQLWRTIAPALGQWAEEQTTCLCKVLGLVLKTLGHPSDVGVKPGMAVTMSMAVAMSADK